MARRPGRRGAAASGDDAPAPIPVPTPEPPPAEVVGDNPAPIPLQTGFADHPLRTGRKLLRVSSGEHKAVESLLRSRASLRVHPGDVAAAAAAAMPTRSGALPEGEGVFFERLGVLTINPDPDQSAVLAALAAEDNALEGEEWERYVFAGADPAFLTGYRAGVDALVSRLLAGEAGDGGAPPGTDGGADAAARAGFADDNRTTWGLKATRADAARNSGKGVRLAVLDTGIDLTHPDFAGRVLAHASFIGGPSAQDRHGHGTHCAGTAAGPMAPARRPRYGVATEALLHVGKVLGDNGVGSDTSILGGIEWAIAQGCAIISMSLGAPVRAGQPRSRAFEQVGRRALDAGAVIIAAAGNDSERPGQVERVSHPANCRTFFAVAALDPRLRVARFSNAGLELDGGQVDVSGPGVQVHSAVPGGYAKLDGTSMATPHVAGLAALIAEKEPDLRGHALLAALSQRALRLTSSSADVGVGLAQAP